MREIVLIVAFCALAWIVAIIVLGIALELAIWA